MTNAEPLFVDTNILVYANVVAAPLHEHALHAIQKAHQAGRVLWISRQVLCEFIAAHTRPQTFTQLSTPGVIIERLRYLESRFQVADDTGAVTKHLINLVKNFQIVGKQIYDANIVATMLAYDVPCLLIHNIKDFQRFGKMIRIEKI